LAKIVRVQIRCSLVAEGICWLWLFWYLNSLGDEKRLLNRRDFTQVGFRVTRCTDTFM
jgi:hypothetical protein